MTTTSLRQRPIAERVQSYIDRELIPIPLQVRPDHVTHDTRALLRRVFPEWKDEEVSLDQEQDGVTNMLLRCTRRSGKERTVVLVRVYGNATETMIYRDREMRNFVSLHLNGYAPKLLERFTNGLVYEFVPGRVLSKQEMSDPLYARAVARLLASWHRDMPTIKNTDQFWEVIRNWISQIPSDTAREPCEDSTESEIILRSNKRKRWIEENLVWLEKHAKSVSDHAVFSHNDLLHANIIVQDSQDGTTCDPVVAFIDYEYGCSNDMHFDVANHFLEFAGFECNWNALPTKDLQTTFLEAYLKSFKNTDSISAEEVEQELARVTAYFSVSHFYWATWALLQAAISKIDFDYEGYGERKMEAFLRERKRIEGS
ncbi:protein of unknown function [Taphrina deformans PYCC 5710]|uniref:ethanolamine kinase n=1 Tax=Taphrina deformans (strain PYCC 5710 / ATCC 11124 / CBS 356.35 / IMI 108563 / JCM 9778 / NBRC 8474) TaxID=1097556 RepID=R4XFD4_TAPDE|nr:protein of unknown function [Taphrina deformans PYCC 5710]|eukprot:CCG84584.1 protein of unknown function [Taphrina deformans PYCC 5710]